jgi:FkbM family methyltransferase
VKLLRRLAERIGVYDRIRYSRPYEWALRLRNPQYLAHLQAEAELYRAVLTGYLRCTPRLIFDVGANFGDKTWAFRRLGARVVCVEPDSRCAAALRVRFRRDRAVTVEPVALGEAQGAARLYVQSAGSAYNTLSTKHRDAYHGSASDDRGCLSGTSATVPVSTLEAMIARYGVPDYLKIDVEGFEAPVFRGLSRPIPVVSFEANLPAFAKETLEVISRLETLDPGVRFNVLPANARALLLAEPVTGDELRRILAGSEPKTFDIFAFGAHPLARETEPFSWPPGQVKANE